MLKAYCRGFNREIRIFAPRNIISLACRHNGRLIGGYGAFGICIQIRRARPLNLGIVKCIYTCSKNACCRFFAVSCRIVILRSCFVGSNKSCFISGVIIIPRSNRLCIACRTFTGVYEAGIRCSRSIREIRRIACYGNSDVLALHTVNNCVARSICAVYISVLGLPLIRKSVGKNSCVLRLYHSLKSVADICRLVYLNRAYRTLVYCKCNVLCTAESSQACESCSCGTCVDIVTVRNGIILALNKCNAIVANA